MTKTRLRETGEITLWNALDVTVKIVAKELLTRVSSTVEEEARVFIRDAAIGLNLNLGIKVLDEDRPIVLVGDSDLRPPDINSELALDKIIKQVVKSLIGNLLTIVIGAEGDASTL